MNIVIFNSEKEGCAWLTDEMPDRRVILRLAGIPNVPGGDYEPSDALGSWEPAIYAASIVYTWAEAVIRTERGIAYARQYLSRWPEGPQADPEHFKASRAQAAAFAKAASELKGPYDSLDDMTPEQLRADLARMTEQLSNYAPGSPHAILLQWRIGVAEALLRRAGFMT
jgi:hypothetical protein